MVAREQAKEACHLSRRDERRREELDEVGVCTCAKFVLHEFPTTTTRDEQVKIGGKKTRPRSLFS
jgi:hypothetical protein